MENNSIIVFQSGGLVSNTRYLAEMTVQEKDNRKMVALATATVLMGAAALEALLSEAAHTLKPDLYEQESYRLKGVPKKFKLLMGYESEDAKIIWDARKAVAHSEPHNKRSRFVGSKLNVDGAKWVISTLENISREVWGDSMPGWFKNDAGLA